MVATVGHMIPQEILDLILISAIDTPSTLLNCALASKNWTFLSRQHVFRNIFLHERNTGLLFHLLASEHETISLHIRHIDCQLRGWLAWLKIASRHANIHLRALESLHLEDINIDGRSHARVLTPFTSISRLRLTSVVFLEPVHPLSFISQFGLLEDLFLRNVHLLSVPAAPLVRAKMNLHLRSVSFDGHIPSVSLTSLMTGIPMDMITRLRWTNIQGYGVEDAQRLIGLLGNLQHLELSLSLGLDAFDLTGFRYLETLHLHLGVRFEQEIQSLVPLPDLRVLIFSLSPLRWSALCDQLEGSSVLLSWIQGLEELRFVASDHDEHCVEFEEQLRGRWEHPSLSFGRTTDDVLPI
ncbi:hypothetical protein C8J56DRAFT_978617 [Mycena floridula]|nr:hypothetical protein C8J56DRAFT_978617 [Mycena floridula]